MTKRKPLKCDTLSVKFSVSLTCPDCKKRFTIGNDKFIGYNFTFWEDQRFGDHLEFGVKCPKCERDIEVDLR